MKSLLLLSSFKAVFNKEKNSVTIFLSIKLYFDKATIKNMKIKFRRNQLFSLIDKQEIVFSKKKPLL